MLVLVLALCAPVVPVAAASASGPPPGSPAFVARDNQNVADAYGRQTAPGGQLQNQAYLPALVAAGVPLNTAQALEQAASPTRPALTPGELFPGWNVGNPLRASWPGTRGRVRRVAWTNRYGALIRGDVFAPAKRARDPYTGRRLQGPYPGVVITPGSVQGSERMYWWLAEDLAERGYVVLVYDVQGQGTSETLPHQGPVNDLPFCNPFAPPRDLEEYGCPGVPSQQAANFVHGTRDAITFLRSRPGRRYPNPASGSARVDAVNPFWRQLDGSPDRRSVTRGRRVRVAVIGHSLGAFAISYVQGIDRRVEAAVALDKLAGAAQMGVPKPRPVVPALAIQSEYGFTVQPYYLNNGSSLTPSPGPPSQGPDPRREEKTGWDAWRAAGVDTQLVVPRASTHLEYTDIAYALPASRYGQDVASYYVQAWLDKYMKHRRGASARLRARSFKYLEPVGGATWSPVRLKRADRLSFYYCSGLAWRRGPSGSRPSSRGRVLVRRDMASVGGC
jgi:fermentation-respiration switch protein FrsA (DUF1100 family)